jgi:hypothetical protein
MAQATALRDGIRDDAVHLATEVCLTTIYSTS